MSDSKKPNTQDPEEIIDDAIKAAQDGVLKGARKLQKTYRSLINGEVKETLKDSHLLAFGAGLGAGVGLGASLLLKLHPVGRIAAIVTGAAGGAIIAGLSQDESNDESDDGEVPRANQGQPV